MFIYIFNDFDKFKNKSIYFPFLIIMKKEYLIMIEKQKFTTDKIKYTEYESKNISTIRRNVNVLNINNNINIIFNENDIGMIESCECLNTYDIESIYTTLLNYETGNPLIFLLT